jgi:electron transfer flavoprotein beta subunit
MRRFGLMISIIVCMKVVIDPEMSLSEFAVDRVHLRPIPPKGTPPLISPFDENALEAALKIKDGQECKITILSVGCSLPKAILQMPLATGADEVITVEDPQFEHLDAINTAHALAAAIKKIDGYDLVFTGRQASDWDSGMVWAGIAELLDIPSVTIARKAEVSGGKIVVERNGADGIEIVECPLPALVTFSSEVGELRYPTVPALQKAKKKEIQRWSASHIGFSKAHIMEVRDLYIPDFGAGDCQLVPGADPEQKGRDLARRLMDDGIIPRHI